MCTTSDEAHTHKPHKQTRHVLSNSIVPARSPITRYNNISRTSPTINSELHAIYYGNCTNRSQHVYSCVFVCVCVFESLASPASSVSRRLRAVLSQSHSVGDVESPPWPGTDPALRPRPRRGAPLSSSLSAAKILRSSCSSASSSCSTTLGRSASGVAPAIVTGSRIWDDP